MELKVWMDGIQRVVSGAGYDTTCRDVVLALAQAMGRTGRFTLVEKWRESERPLTPAECPLLSLHKWGEYAREVQFYLIQAEREKHKGLKRGNYKDGKLDEYINKNSQGYVYANTSGNDSLKRSLTFTGVNTVSYVLQPSSTSGDGDASSYKGPMVQGHDQKIMSYSASSADNSGREALKPLPNGDLRLANNYSNHHAFQPALKQAGRYDQMKPSPADMSSLTHMNRGDGKKIHPDLSRVHMAHSVQNNRGDSREIHPANLPGSTSPYHSSQATPQQNVLYPVSSHQRALSHHPPTSLQSQFPSHLQTSQKTNLDSVAPQKLNFNTSSSAQGPMPANRLMHQAHTVLEPQSRIDSNLKPQLQQSSSNPLSTFGHQQPYQTVSSQHLTAHNSRPQTKQRPLPAPRHTQNLLPEYPNVSSQGKILQTPQPRQRSRERTDSSQLGQPQQQQTAVSEQIKSSNFHNTKKPILDDSFYSNDDNKFPKPSGLRYAQQRRLKDDYKQSAVVPDNANANNNSQDSIKLTENTKQPLNSKGYAYKSSTLERSVPRQTKAIPGPARSLSTGETNESKPGMDSTASTTFQTQPSSEGSKFSFVDSALKKQSRLNIDAGKVGAVSTFASAVAHLRQRSADGTFKPNMVAHVRQHSSDAGHSDAALVPGNDLNRTMIPSSPGQNVASVVYQSDNIASPSSEIQNKLPPSQPHIPPSSTSLPTQSFSPISSRLSSAFKEVSPRASSGQGAQSHMAAPTQHDSSRPSFSTFGIGLLPVQAPNDGKHSRQPSVEIEEYDLDQNFHDFSHRDPGGGGSLGVKSLNIPLEYSLESGNVTPAKSETEYLQLVRFIKMQEERLQMQDAKIHDTEVEISTIETQEAQNQSSKDAMTEELSRLEKTELEGKQELLELEKVEWGNIINAEKQRESSMKSQMVKIKEKIEEMGNKLRKLQEEEERLNKELQAEKESVESKKAKREEGEKMTTLETSKLKDELSRVNKTLEERENIVKGLEDAIKRTEEDINAKEKKVETMTKEIVEDSTDDVLNQSATTESTPVSPASRSPNLSASDNGEAILKILEGRLSPHPGLEGIPGEGFKSAHSKLKSPLATKNPNGVWV